MLLHAFFANSVNQLILSYSSKSYSQAETIVITYTRDTRV